MTWKDRNPKLIMEKLVYLMTACHLVLPLIDTDYGISVPLLLVADGLLVRELRNIKLDDRAACGKFFVKNNIYGFTVFIALAIMGYGKYISQSLD